MAYRQIKPKNDHSIITALCGGDEVVQQKLTLSADIANLMPSNILAYGYLSLLCLQAALLVAFGVGMFHVMGYWSVPCLLMLWGGIGNQCIILLHEAAHHTLVKTPSQNNIIGGFLAASMALNFKSFSQSHMKHHRLNGKDNDEEAFQLRQVTSIKGLVLYLLAPPKLGMVFAADKPTATRSKNSLLNKIPPHLIYCSVIHSALILIQYLLTANIVLSVLFTLSIPTTAVMLRKLRVLTEHCSELGKTEPVTRSHAPRLIDGYFLNGYGMNYHIEHHLYPNIPSYRLKHINQYLQRIDEFSDVMQTTSVKETLEKLFKQ